MVRRMMTGRLERTERVESVASVASVGVVAMCARGVADGIGPEEMGWGGSRYVHEGVCAVPVSAERKRSVTAITAVTEGVLQSHPTQWDAMRCTEPLNH
jgi:hypothetical protein